MKKLLSQIYWAIYRLTPKGKQAWMFKNALHNMELSGAKRNIVKWNIIGSAKKILKNQKIIAFHKGKSITTSKTTDHQLKKNIDKVYQDDLKITNTRLSKNLKFKHAHHRD